MKQVFATREGCLGQKTASGYIIEENMPFVALPARRALHKWVLLHNPQNEKWCCAQCLDVGPWNEHDDEYVFGNTRPLAEQGISISQKGTNSAGIDLSEKVWKLLGMKDNGLINWRFLEASDLWTGDTVEHKT